MRFFHTDSGSIAYEVLEAAEHPVSATATGAGEIPTLTLLHNFMSSGRTAWGSLLGVLNRRFRILLPDLPGHGRSVGHPPRFQHLVMARQLAALMHAEGAERGHLAGCSSGGMIAQLLVHHRMVSPGTLTLVSTTYSTDPAATGGNALLPENFLAGDRWLEATARLHDPWQGDGYFFGSLLPAFKALQPDDSINLSLGALEQWQMPVCIIHGDRDEFFPTHVAESMVARLPQGELHLLPGQTHALIFRKPWQVAEVMDAFFSGHAPSARAVVASE